METSAVFRNIIVVSTANFLLIKFKFNVFEVGFDFPYGILSLI